MAIPAVAVALSKFNDLLYSTSFGADEQLEELVTELTWLQCFLVDGEKSAQGRVRTDVWSSAIERLALCAQEVEPAAVYGHHGSKFKDLDKLNSRLASLRAKIQPFLTSQAPSSGSVNIPAVPEIQIPTDIQVAAWGGSGGSQWNFKPKGLIKQITIVHGTIIDSLSFTGTTADGRVGSPIKLGGSGGSKTIQVNISTPSEYLTGISGTYGKHHGVVVITSIKFQTNVTEHGPYGSSDGTPFSFVIQAGGKITGFHGASGDYVDSLGVFVTSK